MDMQTKKELYDIETVCGKVYEDFIRYALKTSDAFMFITFGENPGLSYTEDCIDEFLQGIKACRKNHDDIDLKQVLTLFVSQHWLGHDEELNDKYNQFLAGLAPFLIKIRKPLPEEADQIKVRAIHDEIEKSQNQINERWLEGNIKDEDYQNFHDVYKRYEDVFLRESIGWPGALGDIERRVDIHVYQASENLIPLLLRPGALMNWRAPFMPEDLCFFRNNKSWVSTVTHEYILAIEPKDEEECRILQDMGLPFVEYKEDYGEPFHEDYTL